MRTRTRIGMIGITSAALAAAALLAATGSAGSRQPAGQDIGEQLLDGLRSTKGCLGADAAFFASGKQVIVAWFENKAAATRWYYSATHRGFMGAVDHHPSDNESEPLAHVKDESIPIMVMASMSLDPALAADGGAPFGQLAIELYTPLPGGAMYNGRLAPKTLPVKHFRDLSDS